MFKDACDLARQFTRPVVISTRLNDGKCSSGIGSFVVINRDGWALTAWHIVEEAEKASAAATTFAGLEAQRTAIRDNANLTHNERTRQLRTIRRATPTDITNASTWWSWDGVTVADIIGIPAVDLALFRIVNFNPAWIATYPIFKRPNQTTDAVGRSLCRIGFPFHSITPTFDAARRGFVLPPGSIPIPFFPNDGIFTRTVEFVPDPPLQPAPPFRLRFIETSTPGLRGQSGGPLFDAAGCIWGIQSRTMHLPLGFSPEVPGGRAGEKEHQFLNVGWSVHVETIVGALGDRGVQFELSGN